MPYFSGYVSKTDDTLVLNSYFSYARKVMFFKPFITNRNFFIVLYIFVVTSSLFIFHIIMIIIYNMLKMTNYVKRMSICKTPDYSNNLTIYVSNSYKLFMLFFSFI